TALLNHWFGGRSNAAEEISMLSIRKILHPNDCSEHSANAFQLAVSLARDHGARLLLLYVKPPQETVVGEFGTLPPEPELSDEGFFEKLDNLAASVDNLETDCVVVEGRPVEEILKAAMNEECDLIVLGSHPHSWLGRLWTGDLVNTVIKKAPCPVV